jgi:D-serine deaminase-like pyridoxal phosphate-dependent protein
MSIFNTITKPTLLLDEPTVRANIRRMAAKARAAHVVFRPHFKTHQSHEIGAWFRQEGVRAITVSSLDMAEYFASAGWDDITVALSANIRQIAQMNALAGQIHLGLLVESCETVAALAAGLRHPVDIWIKIDTGTGRTGAAWDQPDSVVRIARQAAASPNLNLRGLLTHAGNTYTAPDPATAASLFTTSSERINHTRDILQSAGLGPLLVSAGDTPGCSALERFPGVDEIRPGNFVFYDAQQYQIGACRFDEIAVALACPVIALHPERGEAVLYGGAVHLSKDTFAFENGRAYALAALPAGEGWGAPLPGCALTRLSQEHGILSMPGEQLDSLRVGDLVCLIPAHSCLTAQVMGHYLTLDGRWIEMMRA